MTTRSMTYAEIADAFGIAPKSARQLVQRKRWMRRTGNDGKVRVDVPIEVLPVVREGPSQAPSEVSSDGPSNGPSEVPSEVPSEGPSTNILVRLIERLEDELRELRPKAVERDVLAGQLEALRASHEQRVTDLQAMLEQMRIERDAERQKATEHDVLAVQVETVKAALEESRRERDKWATTAHALAHPLPPPAPTPRPSRGLLGWLWAARR